MLTDLDAQIKYWNGAAKNKSFTIPLEMERLLRIVPTSSSILDYGCGYGRICAELSGVGYHDVLGVDISQEMIKRGIEMYPREIA